ncbi:MAG: YggT family protein [Solirubrobacterales bacterium]
MSAVIELPLALSKGDLREYAVALFAVYTILILLNILLSFIPRMPFYSPWLRAVLDFITETTDPYLNLFRSFIRPIGGGSFAFDPSPIIALIALGFIEGIVLKILS